MANKYQSIIDLHFTDFGDFVKSSNGDLEDTKNIKNRGLIQKINTIVQSSKGEWSTNKNIGANVSGILGKRNTQEEAEKIRNSILIEILKEGLVSPEDLEVLVFPMSKSSLAIMINIRPTNSQEKVFLSYSYSVKDNRITPRSN